MKAACVSIALMSLLAAAAPAGATTAVALTNRALADGADVIATGRCVGLQTVWEGRTLVTVATIALDDVLKGTPGTTVTVALPGGIDAGRRIPISMTYPGAPQMRIGEEVFLFLNENALVRSGLTVAGFSQGKFSIVVDEQGRRAVSRDLTAISLRGPAGTRRGTATRVPLETFKREIRSYLAGR